MESKIMNENSLANLRQPKVKKEGYGHRYTIPQEKVDELFSYIADGQTIKAAAKSANICFATAKKYYKKGDVNRGIKPLQTRLVVFQEKISEQMNVLLEEQRMSRIETVRKAIKLAENRLFGEYDKDGKLVKEGDIGKCSIKDIERLIKLEVFLTGTIKTKDTERKMLTADEIGA